MLVKTVIPIIKSVLIDRATYDQFKTSSSSIVDCIIGLMPGRMQAKHLEPNIVQTIARLSMI